MLRKNAFWSGNSRDSSNKKDLKSDILIEMKLKYGETVDVERAFHLIGLRRPNRMLYPHSRCVVGVC